MGQSIADGHLPYDHLWDLKPPLLFYIFALVEKNFPHSFVAIRLLGVAAVFLSSILLLKITRQANIKNGFFISLGYVLLSSEFGSLQGVMSEHFTVLFLLWGLFYFLRRKNNFDFLICGVAFGCSVLCKLNYAYAIAALLSVYALQHWTKKELKHTIGGVALVGTGILIPLILMGLPFAVSGKMQLFVNSVFLAPLQYASALNYNWADKFKTTWWIIALTALISYLSIKLSKKETQPLIYASVAILAGTVYTFYSSGIVNGHYLVQLYPFLLILLFGVILQKRVRVKMSIAAIVVFLLSFESMAEYVKLIKSRENPAEYRPTFEIVREIKKRGLDKEKILFADYHIGYWLLGQYPLTKASTHPSNIARPFLFDFYNDTGKTSLQELKYILEEVKPQVIVSQRNELVFFKSNTEENKYFKDFIGRNFTKIYEDTVDRIVIWQRNK
jgi:hypothetical protein